MSDAEFAELEGLLARVPEPLEPLDVVMLDGFIAAIVVQPQRIEVDRWLPYVFDAGGHRWGEAAPDAEQLRARALILRRHAAINRSLAEFGSFDPFILEPLSPDDDSADHVGEATGADTEAAAREPPAEAEAEATLDPVSESLLPWVAGFEFAASIFPGLDDLENDAVSATLARLFRFLPPDTEDDAEVAALVAREVPLGSLDAATADVVACVAELYDLTEPLRYQVDTVRRDSPKVGRNDPCPCGSGRKFKHCHGAG
ncbi:MAG: UPF0149 family protein [Pseudomonadota bacterium]|nr:UPF0149 family protein [Pseudomonadota bacterium]